jgi:hypothetical protein
MQSQGQNGFLVLGNGLPANGRELPASATATTISDLPGGAGAWLITPYWNDPPDRVIDVSTGLRVTATTAAMEGRYRISIAGFRVNHETYDNPASSDGFGDEVYAAAAVFGPPFNGAVRYVVRSAVYGDAHLSDRVQAGHANPLGRGGLLGGDVAPAGWDANRPSTPPLASGWFPVTVWEGTLRAGKDAVTVHPTLWEFDGDSSAYEFWKNWTTGLGSGSTSEPGIVVLRGPESAIFQYAFPSTTDVGDLTNLELPERAPQKIEPGKDRPIGLDGYHPTPVQLPLSVYDRSSMHWVDRYVAFTREKIETMLAAPTPGFSPGIIPVSLVDGDPRTTEGRLQGDYVLYLRVERLP